MNEAFDFLDSEVSVCRFLALKSHFLCSFRPLDSDLHGLVGGTELLVEPWFVHFFGGLVEAGLTAQLCPLLSVSQPHQEERPPRGRTRKKIPEVKKHAT